MKTFNIWKYRKEGMGPTGPWEFAGAVLAADSDSAMLTAKSRFGLEGRYNVYEGV